MQLAKPNQRVYFSLSGIRLISDLLFSQWEDQNEVDRQAILLETLRTLKKGGTFAIHDIFSVGKYGDMHAFVKKLEKMGYSSKRRKL